ncbi:predicted protein [Lodderomyces elongisporus NRRL YB-4239]|uniref:Uncharacterized protein n=1 Tax=Lodderomyces elongisporus (strain ATCC 11503 / CBS 2605 / JCM 1781 / NBRC 1676 / NRRL YB-4239) TaxID=379508 RepID=A5E1C8_LODEL|nr:predicted protein [Lodderomyces elongisporus NRRL YB-4239]
MKFSKAFTVATLAIGALAAYLKPAELVLQRDEVAISGDAYDNLLSILQIDQSTAAALGLTEGKSTRDLVDNLTGLLNARSEEPEVVKKRDLGLILQLVDLKIQKINEAISALLSGKITKDESGYINLLNILEINKTIAADLGLTQGSGTFDLVAQLGKLITIEISKGIGYSKGGDSGTEVKKRDLGLILQLVDLKIQKINEAISALLSGKITKDESGYINLLNILEINKTIAADLGLTQGSGTFDLVAQLGKLITIEISKGIGYSKGGDSGTEVKKRDLGLILQLVDLKIQKINEAISALLSGKITKDESGYINLLNILEINKTIAADLGLTQGSGTFDLVAQLGKLITIEISKGIGYSKGGDSGTEVKKRDLGLILQLVDLKIQKINEAISALLSGKITKDESGYINLLNILEINKTIAADLGLTQGSGTFDLVAQLGKIITVEIDKHIGY